MFTLSSSWILISSFLLAGEGKLHLPKQAQITLKTCGHLYSARGQCLRQAFY
jgi:hypothetical protein